MSEYNGHPTKAHWNVSLWLYNEERLYRLVQEAVKVYPLSRKDAANHLLAVLPGETPDGVRYTYPTVYAAIEDEYQGK